MMPRLEDFQAGIPLNEDLRRLKAGILEEAPPPEAPVVWEPESPDRDLTDDEREDLARLTREPGWRVLKRLRLRALRAMEKAAIVASKENPLGREHEIALGWANLKLFEDQMRLDQTMVDGEIRQLKERE